MDLIRRDDAFAALGEMPENWTNSPEEIEAVNSWCYAVEAINSVPSVEAVPPDKLCEWLARNAFAFECEGCEEYCRALLDCENEVGSDPKYWKNKLTEWMEKQGDE